MASSASSAGHVRPVAANTAPNPPLRLATALGVGAGLVALLAVTLLFQHLRGREPSELMRDPTSIHGMSPLIGLFSNLGIFVMFCAGGAAVFASRHARRRQGLLRAAGLLTLVVAFDDFFMVHDYFVPGLLGLDELFFLVPLGLAAGAVFVVYRRELASREHAALWLALALLSASIAVDVLVPFSPRAVLVEDGFKFVGLCLWALYWIRLAQASMEGN